MSNLESEFRSLSITTGKLIDLIKETLFQLKVIHAFISPSPNAEPNPFSAVHGQVAQSTSKEGAEGREYGEDAAEEGACTNPPFLFRPSYNNNNNNTPQALQQGNNDGARIYASNSIRKKSESLSLLRLASRLDAVASRVETAVTMRQVTGNMTSVVKGMDKAMETMNLERVRPLPPSLPPMKLTLRRSRSSWTSSSPSSPTSTCRRRTWKTRWVPRRPCRRHRTRWMG